MSCECSYGGLRRFLLLVLGSGCWLGKVKYVQYLVSSVTLVELLLSVEPAYDVGCL